MPIMNAYKDGHNNNNNNNNNNNSKNECQEFPWNTLFRDYNKQLSKINLFFVTKSCAAYNPSGALQS